MRKRWLVMIGAVVLAAGGAAAVKLPGPVHDALRGLKYRAEFAAWVRGLPAKRLADVMVPMPDGIKLATDIYLPEDGPARKPAILVRLPYGKDGYPEARHWVSLFTPHGYAVVVQDMRGRFGSQGVFAPYPHAASDGAATLDWIAAQGWSDGQVGTIGCSALGESQVILAAARPKQLKAMVPIGAGGAIGTAGGVYGYFGMFEGGIPELASAYGWFARWGGKTGDRMDAPPIDYARGLATLPLRDAIARARPDPTDFEAMLDGFDQPGFGAHTGFIGDDARFATPALMVDNWYDQSVSSTLVLSKLMRRSAPDQHVLIGPGGHCDSTGPFSAGHVGDMAVKGRPQPYDRLYLGFMDARLKDAPPKGPGKLPPYRFYVLGEDVWRDAESWPPAAARQVTYRLAGDGLSRAGASAGARSLTSDPMDPVPTLGGAICCTGDPATRDGPLDQRPVEARADVLSYSSAPLQVPLRIAGPISARLTVSTDVPDTDLVARLTDVAPDGTSLMIQEGALRLRYRDGFADPKLMQPGQSYTVTIRLRDIAWLVRPGHRLRLDIAGSSYPRLARNLNGGGDPNRETVPHKARITIAAPSELTLYDLPE
ncbi:CocE/NonD family hydrolase [Acidimangrovimonas pyrenivorans]|uniref:CocE/NonD family hydrolase n=1 Tax=Acidimangrovimonas pyrenivorans TaxID=2030798 RepID=A0ABV7ACB8_9RHOB